MRLQQEQRQREISLMAYQGASSSFISPPPLNPSECIFAFGTRRSFPELPQVQFDHPIATRDRLIVAEAYICVLELLYDAPWFN